jgi:outer membrane immunogenic protein
MRKLLLGSVALVALIAGPAMAADMPVYKGPPPVAVYNWAGCYVGVAGGWVGSRVTHDRAPTDGLAAFVGPAETAAAARSTDARSSAGIIGGTIGCNMQTGVVVFGVEGDWSWTGAKNSFNENFPDTPGGAFSPRTETGSVNSDWLSTLRGRLGVLVSPNLLLYVTGGVAIGHFNSSFNVLTANGSNWAGSASTIRTGAVIGGGGEWALGNSCSGCGGWSLKAEYLYVDFGKYSFAAPNRSVRGGAADPAFNNWTSTIHASEQIVRVGLNYKFSGGAVSARY